MCTFIAVDVWLLYFISNKNLAKSEKFQAHAQPNGQMAQFNRLFRSKWIFRRTNPISLCLAMLDLVLKGPALRLHIAICSSNSSSNPLGAIETGVFVD